MVLATKLFVPPPRPAVIHRGRLVERLNEGLLRKLTLVQAPAGFGKTTLVSAWLAAAARRAPPVRVAWLSLDEGDNDPSRFLAYLVAALRTGAADLGAGVLSMLASPQPPPAEVLLTGLINEIAAQPHGFVLVLDDYHAITAQPVHQALAFLIDNQPPQLRVVIASRESPPLPLARLRARDQLTELTAADLRFTPTEAAEFLNQVMGLDLSAGDIAALEERTEGWVAGLQLAALALQAAQGRPAAPHGPPDVAAFIRAFSGSHRFVFDYLVEEVLQRQPAAVRSFLLQTAILTRLSGPLCDAVCSPGPAVPGHAVTGAESAQSMLEALDRSNLFVIPLDDRRQWYRYHHLFAEVLHARLLAEQPDMVPVLHRRASRWYAAHGSPSEAIHHALAAQDFAYAADLIELAWPAMDRSFQSAAWLAWAQALPAELVRLRPVLSLGYAWALLGTGQMDAVLARLQDAERWLGRAGQADPPATPPAEAAPDQAPGMVVVDHEQFHLLPASLACARAYHAMALGDIPATLQFARQALDLAPPGDLYWRGAAMSLLGLAYYARGDLAAAEEVLTGFMDTMAAAGKIPEAISITFTLAEIRLALGRLQDAITIYQQALRLAARPGDPLPLGASDLYRGLSELSCERDDLEAAAQQLTTARQLGEVAALTDWPHRLCIAEARLAEARGDLDGALRLLDAAERYYVGSPLPEVRPAAALQARLWARQGRPALALNWARRQGLSPNDDLTYLREFEHLTLARALLAQAASARVQAGRAGPSIHPAIQLLERLQAAAGASGRMGRMIEILVLQALAYQAQGDLPPAIAALEHALTLAEPEGYVRTFVDEGSPLAELLARLQPEGNTLPAYIDRLLAAFAPSSAASPDRSTSGQAAAPDSAGATPQPLIEPLSERELEVLRLLRSELSGPEIAATLFISLNTLRTHTKNIYAKLEVNNRRAAVRRAVELGLL